METIKAEILLIRPYLSEYQEATQKTTKLLLGALGRPRVFLRAPEEV